MIDLHITGATPEEFYRDAIKTLAVLARAVSPVPGGIAAAGAVSASDQPHSQTAPAAVGDEPQRLADQHVTGPTPRPDGTTPMSLEQAAKRARGRPRSKGHKTTLSAEADVAADAADAADAALITPQPVDASVDSGVPGFLTTLSTEEMPGPVGKPVLEDVRNAIRTYNKAVRARGQTLESGVKYITPLFEKYGIAKVSDLPEAKYAEFIWAVQPYTSGTAPGLEAAA